MTGVILIALREIIKKKYNKNTWEKILKAAGVKNRFLITPFTSIENSLAERIIHSASSRLGMTLEELGDVFGDYWINVYSQKHFADHYKNIKNAREFLLKLNHIHKRATKNIHGAEPPLFEFTWKDKNTLIIKYVSKKNLADWIPGLIKAVGKFYNEDLKIKRIRKKRFEVTFK